MLTAATLGFSAYGVYSAGSAIFDVLSGQELEIWAHLGMIAAGLVLNLAAALVRVQVPGGLALAISGLLALQALSLHNETHVYGAVSPALQIVRGGVAATLVALAYAGARRPHR